MKIIRAKYPPPDPADTIILIGDMTLSDSMILRPGQEVPIIDKEILKRPEVKKYLEEGKIEIIDESSSHP